MERKTENKKANGLTMVDMAPPFEEDPYDMFHPEDLNSVKCCSVAAWRYYGKRHLTKRLLSNQDGALIAERVRKSIQNPRSGSKSV
jgi:hypothetical protein